jgi:hypothetical protein
MYPTLLDRDPHLVSLERKLVQSPWVPYGRGDSNSSKSKHRNVYQEGLERAAQRQLYNERSSSRSSSPSVSSRSSSRVKVTAASSRSSSPAINQSSKPRPIASRYMSDSHIIVRATLIDHTGYNIQLHISQPPKIVHGILVLQRQHPSIDHLIAEIEEQWHLPLADSSGGLSISSSISDIRIIAMSPYTNRMQIRCLSLGTIEAQPIIEDSSCHIEVFINQQPTQDEPPPHLVREEINQSISNTVHRVLAADKGSFATSSASSPLSQPRTLVSNRGSSPSNSRQHQIFELLRDQHASYVSLGQSIASGLDDADDQMSVASRAFSDLSGATSMIDSSATSSSTSTNRYHFFSPPKENVLLGYYSHESDANRQKKSKSKPETNSRLYRSNSAIDTKPSITTYSSPTPGQQQQRAYDRATATTADVINVRKPRQQLQSKTIAGASVIQDAMPMMSHDVVKEKSIGKDSNHLRCDEEYHHISTHSPIDADRSIQLMSDSPSKLSTASSSDADTATRPSLINVAKEFIPIITKHHHISNKYHDDDDDEDEDDARLALVSRRDPYTSYPSDLSSQTTTDRLSSRSASNASVLSMLLVEDPATTFPGSCANASSAPVTKERQLPRSHLKAKGGELTNSAVLPWQRVVQLDLNDVLMDFD